MKLKYTPRFFDEKKAGMDYVPDLGAARREGMEFARNLATVTAERLQTRGAGTLAVLTDLLQDFRDRGRLPVKGADAVVFRVCLRLIYGVTEGDLAGVIAAIDGHPFGHISFDSSWIGSNGKPIDLSNHGKAGLLTLDSKEKATFRLHVFNPDGTTRVLDTCVPAVDPQDAVLYYQYLRASGQGDIWVFVPHCIIGTDGTNFHPLLAETLAFCSGVRQFDPHIINKGYLRDTDWFGPLQACRPNSKTGEGMINNDAISLMKRFSAIEFMGVAEDFCELGMRRVALDTLDVRGYDGVIRFITDGTAPIVPEADHVTEFYELARNKGVKFITHDEIPAA